MAPASPRDFCHQLYIPSPAYDPSPVPVLSPAPSVHLITNINRPLVPLSCSPVCNPHSPFPFCFLFPLSPAHSLLCLFPFTIFFSNKTYQKDTHTFPSPVSSSHCRLYTHLPAPFYLLSTFHLPFFVPSCPIKTSSNPHPYSPTMVS